MPPVYIAKIGYGEAVILRMKDYEEKPALADVYAKLAKAEAEIQEEKTMDALAALEALRAKYGV